VNDQFYIVGVSAF